MPLPYQGFQNCNQIFLTNYRKSRGRLGPVLKKNQNGDMDFTTLLNQRSLVPFPVLEFFIESLTIPSR